MPWTSPGGSDPSSGGGGIDYGSVFGVKAAQPAAKSGPFIDWTSPSSLITAGARALAGSERAGLNLMEQATTGLPGMAVAVGGEGLNALKLLGHDVTHPGWQSLEQLSGIPTLTHAAASAAPLLGGIFDKGAQPWGGTPQLPPSDGMTKPGNLDPWNRKILHNPDGSYSTTSSISVGSDAGEVLIPTVIDGVRLSNDEAIKHFQKTGENFGTFRTPAEADAYAVALHNAQARHVDGAATPAPDVPTGWQAFMQQVGKEAPASGGFVGSLARTGQDIEQTARAAGNTVLPGHPLGSGVGELGSGPGLLGKTDLGKAVAAGGPGIGPKALEDVTNLSLLGGPVESLVGASADSAAAQAAEHGKVLTTVEGAAKEATKAAEANVDQAAKQAEVAVEALRQAQADAAASGHPVAAANVATRQGAADAAMNALREAQAHAEQIGGEHANNIDLAQQARDAAQAHADTLAKHLDTVKLVNALGSKAAASPFAPLEVALPAVLGKAGELAHAVVGTHLGQTYLQPVLDRAHDYAAARAAVSPERDVLANRAADEQAPLTRGFEQAAAPTNLVTEKRGLLGRTKEVRTPDPAAEAVAIMHLTGEHEQLRQTLLNTNEHRTPQMALDEFSQAMPHHADGTPQYSPEALQLAAHVVAPDVVGDTPRAAEIRAAIPQVRENYAAGAEPIQAENYGRLRGEVAPVLGKNAGPGAFGQVEHNLEGQGANIEHLEQTRVAQEAHDRKVGVLTAQLERQGARLERATQKAGNLGLTPEELTNPARLYERVTGPAIAAARSILGTDGVAAALSQAPEQRLQVIGKALASGHLDETSATRNLATAVMDLARKDPAKLSEIGRWVLEEAQNAGLVDVPKGRLPSLTATAPAERIGAGTERARQGEQQLGRGLSEIGRGDVLQGRAAERYAAPTRARGAALEAAHTRLVAAAAKFGGLVDKIKAATEATKATEGAHPLEAAGLSRESIANDVRELRQNAAAELLAEANQHRQDLYDAGAEKMQWPPPTVDRPVMNRSGNMKGRDVIRKVHDPNFADDVRRLKESGDTFGRTTPRKISEKTGEVIPERFTPDPRFFAKDGMTPADIEHRMSQDATAASAAKFEGSGTLDSGAAHGAGLDAWLEKVATIIDYERQAKVKPDIGWEPGSRAADLLVEAFARDYGPEAARQMADDIISGHPLEAADRVAGRLNQIRSADDPFAENRAARQAKVAAALEADRANEVERGRTGARQGRASLDELGKAEYDRQIAEDQARIQGQVVDQRTGQASRAAALGADQARAQGQAEGAMLGQSRQLQATGEQRAAQGERAVASGEKITGQAPELAQAAVGRVARPIADLYRRAGAAEHEVLSAAQDYAKTQRAIEREGGKLADQFHDLMASIEAQPRAMRPILEAGRRINETLLPIADAADRDIGPGAGDVWRTAAAQAVVNADFLRKAGIDPQYVIGSHEGPGGQDLAARPPTAGLPGARATGQRSAGLGLAHATTFEDLHKAAAARLSTILKTESMARLVEANGGKVADMLATRGIDGAAAMKGQELAAHLSDQKLTAIDVLGRPLQVDKITPESLTLPNNIFKEYRRYVPKELEDNVVGHFLKSYDTILRHWKAATLVLTGRWHSSLILGHAVMAMVGGDINPADYARAVTAAVRLEKIRQAGTLTEADRAWLGEVAKTHPNVAQALDQTGGFTPGSVVDRGYSRTEFGAGREQGSLLRHPMQRGWAFQSHLDNINRTAVWIAKLDEGLDARGLSDFRAAYPQLAHLSDPQIQNEAAIRLSIRTVGDYKNLSRTEQGLVRRVIPFYPWIRHITKLAANLAIHDPIRVAWLLHLPALFAPDQPNTPDWLHGSINIGGNRWVTPPHWNPFGSIGNAADPDNPFGAVSPLIKAPFAVGLGLDIAKRKMMTRPPGVSGGMDPNEALYYLGSQIPQVKAAREALPALRGNEPIVRYGTGQPIISHGRFIPSNEDQWLGSNTSMPAPLAPLLPLLGVPRQQQIDTGPIFTAQQKAARKNATSLADYQRRRALLGSR